MARTVLTNFRAQDFKGLRGGEVTPKKAKAPKAAPIAQVNEDGVPEGSVDEVLAWVGDDLDKAQIALDAENARDKPRVTAVSALEAILEPTPEVDPDDDSGADSE